jgi:predicted kinase
VLGTADDPRLGGAGDAAPQAIDWLLRMRRFDEADVLANVAARGELTEAMVDALAAELAAFHRALPPSPAPFGSAAIVRRWLGETLAGLAAAGDARVEPLRAWCEREAARLAPLIDERRARGFVREGHADLHLANIVLVGGVPQPFDAVEFNAELRHVDVVHDIAFTFMDLMRHGLPALAWRFAGAWAERSGDVEGLTLLRFFAVERALVRSRVALLRADPDALERDLALAARLATSPPPAPLLVLVCGLSGSGKSTVAQRLAQEMSGIRLRSDVERKRLHGLAATERPAADQVPMLYGREATRRTYARLGDLARTLLDAGIPAIVDAAALRRDERDELRALAATRGAAFALVECDAPEPVLRERIARRQREAADASDADLAVLDLQLRVCEPVQPDETAQRVSTDCDRATLHTRCATLAAALAPPHSTSTTRPPTS